MEAVCWSVRDSCLGDSGTGQGDREELVWLVLVLVNSLLVGSIIRLGAPSGVTYNFCIIYFWAAHFFTRPIQSISHNVYVCLCRLETAGWTVYRSNFIPKTPFSPPKSKDSLSANQPTVHGCGCGCGQSPNLPYSKGVGSPVVALPIWWAS